MKDANVIVQDSLGNTMETQFVPLDNVTEHLREFYLKAYTGRTPKSNPNYWLIFQASLPPLGWNTYFISKPYGKGSFISLL